MRWISLISVVIGANAQSLNQPFTSSFSQLEHAACVSLFHRNGRTGCGTSDRDTKTGKLVYYAGQLSDDAFVAVIEEDNLTADTLDALMAARGGALKGILVLNTTNSNSQTNSFTSPDSQTPQGYGTPSVNLNYGYAAYPWNPKGENLFNYDLYGVPMAYVLDSDVSQSIREEAQSGNADSSIVAEFNYYMGPENMNSIDCLAWKDVDNQWYPKCLPLAGTSVWASAGSPPSQNKLPVYLIAAGMDSTSMFHDATPGANTAASNIMTIVMAAKLVGAYVNDQALDGFSSRIVFALFQGESYGFVGSRSFLRDVVNPGFSCKSTLVKSGKDDEYGCLNPARPSIKFADLGEIAGMIAVDQVGHAVANDILYVHSDGDDLATLLQYSATDDVSVVASNAADNGNGYPYPPSPLTSLLSITGGGVGGAVLTGFDNSFTSKVPYHSHLDTAEYINLDTIAAAATIVARAAVAAAYGGDDAANTAKNLIPSLSSDDDMLVELSNCLLYNGQCDLIKKYAQVEAVNERVRTGLNIDIDQPMEKNPNYYVGVYNSGYGQPFVQVGSNQYGAYNGNDFGNKKSDAIAMMPPQLERAIRGLFNDFLGSGSASADGNVKIQSCKKSSDCANINYCQANGDVATCTGGGNCVCQRSYFHVALDQALRPAENKATGFFEVDEDNNSGYSPIYTEPYWSNSVGVRVYRDVGVMPGVFTLVAGLLVGGASMFGALVLKIGLKKEKLY